MPRIDIIVGTSIIVYFATAITEIVSSVPVGLTQSDFGDNCILSGSVYYYSSNKTFRVDSFGNPGACGYCTYLTICTVLYALGYGSYSAYAIYRSVDNASLMWVLPAILACALFFVLKFISSCILSVGFSKFCDDVTDFPDVPKCQTGQGSDYSWIHNQQSLNGGHYYSYMTTAQSASWFCVFEWFLLSGLTFFHYRRNISLRSSGTTAPGDGFGAADTSGIVANEILPG